MAQWRECGGKGTLVLPLWKTVQRFFQKIGNRTTIWSSNIIWVFAWRNWNHSLTVISVPLRSLQHYSQQPKHGNNLNVYQWSTDEWIKKIWGIHTRTRIFLSHKKTRESCLLWQHRWPWGYHAKWNKSSRKTNTVWSPLHMESKKAKIIETVDLWLPEAAGWGDWEDVGHRWKLTTSC